jgi:biotin operon repressor
MDINKIEKVLKELGIDIKNINNEYKTLPEVWKEISLLWNKL